MFSNLTSEENEEEKPNDEAVKNTGGLQTGEVGEAQEAEQVRREDEDTDEDASKGTDEKDADDLEIKWAKEELE